MHATLATRLSIALIAISICQTSIPAQQAGRQDPLEAFITRIRDGLSLSVEQTTQFRDSLARRATKMLEFRRRLQTEPYSLVLQAEIEAEQRAIREELTAFLSDEQKTRLPGLDLRPVPQPPGFVLINVPPRVRLAVTTPLARAERLIAAVPFARDRLARLNEDQKILHVLNRLTFGPRPGDVELVRRVGIDRFIEDQLRPELIDDSEIEKRVAVLPTLQMSSLELYQYYPPANVAEQRARDRNPPPVFGRPQQVLVELQQQKLLRAVASNRQLQEVMTDFWFNHFNVFAQKDGALWQVTSYERDVIRLNALGKFRDLLRGTAQSPAMLLYLDNWASAAPDSRLPRPPVASRPQPQTPPRPQEMPADRPMTEGTPSMPQTQQMLKPPPPPQPRRPGINENYARELMELHTLGVNGGYTQKDVQEVARCFTGWSVDRANQGGAFVFRRWQHDSGSKTVLGAELPAGGGMDEGLRVIEILSRHPSTARLISRKLCQRFVSDKPPAGLVERVAQVFLRTDGDIRDVLRAIFKSPEFYSAATFRSKVKSPLELVASAIRALDGDTNGAPALHEWIRRMGSPFYQCQAPTGYGEDSSRWLNPGVLLSRLNFGVTLTNNQIPGTRYEAERLVGRAEGYSAKNLINRVTALVTHTELSPESMRAAELGAGVVQPPLLLSAAFNKDTTAGSEDPARVAAEGQPAATAQGSVSRILELLFGTSEFQRK